MKRENLEILPLECVQLYNALQETVLMNEEDEDQRQFVRQAQIVIGLIRPEVANWNTLELKDRVKIHKEIIVLSVPKIMQVPAVYADDNAAILGRVVVDMPDTKQTQIDMLLNTTPNNRPKKPASGGGKKKKTASGDKK